MTDRSSARGLTFIAVTTLSLLLASRAAFAACPGFATAVNSTAGTGPSSIAAGDFNGDGRVDLAVANAGSDNVSVFIATGLGSFAAAVNYGAGNAPAAIVTADFNRDGKLDLAVANSNSDTVSILLGTGTGTFGTANDFSADASPISLTAADFNRDGKIDLAVANSGANDVVILLGAGDGTFVFNGSYGAHDGVVAVAAADFNNDGLTDLAVANATSQDVSLLPGIGDGSFDVAQNSPTILGVASVSVGDFNRDGNADVVVPTGIDGNIDVAILRGSGNFGLVKPVYFGVDDVPTFAAVGDFNGDGRPDLAVADRGGSTVSILLQLPNGSFAASVPFGAHTAPASIAVGDFDNDGKADLAVANSLSNDMSVLLNNGTCPNFTNFCGRFGTNTTFPVGTTPEGIAIADFNDDGRLDAAVANSASDSVSILFGNGSPSFVSGGTVNLGPAGTFPTEIATGDFNRDGYPDLVVANFSSQNYSILLFNGVNAFSTTTSAALGLQIRGIKVGDFNRDGIDDLIICGSSLIVYYAAGNGDGTFQTPVRAGTGTGDNAVAVGDINGDGKLDFVASDSFNNRLDVNYGNGDGTFAAPVHVPITGTPGGLFLGDFDRDGDLDIAVLTFGPEQLSVIINNGATFAAPVAYAIGKGPSRVTGGDFDGDGKIDLAVTRNFNGRGVAVLRGVGNGTFEPPVPYATDNGVWGVAAADFDRDGRTDILVSNYSSTTVSLLLNACPTAIDLTINKTHDGSSFQVGTPGVYRMVVSNIGGPPTNGTTVTVIDALPAGMTATSMIGGGWNCTPASATCTTNNSLAGAASYPTITLTVDMDNGTTSPSVNSATVSGGGDANGANNGSSDSVSVVLLAPPAPANLVAQVDPATGFVHLTWDPTPRADFYGVYRSTNAVDYTFQNNTFASPDYLDTNFTPNTTYFYKVKGVNNGGIGPESNRDYATTIVFTDDPLGNNTTTIKLVHLDELRKGVNAFHRVTSPTDLTFSDALAPGLRIKATQINELRTALNSARAAMGLAPLSFGNTVAPGTAVGAGDFQQLRDAVK